MNWDRIQGNWKQVKGKFKERWGRITDDQLDVIAGRRDQLVGIVQESYGIARDEAEQQVREWEAANEQTFDTAAKSGRKVKRTLN